VIETAEEDKKGLGAPPQGERLPLARHRSSLEATAQALKCNS
jgi:hypothetical protein